MGTRTNSGCCVELSATRSGFLVADVQGDNVTFTERGNSQTYLLKRLARDQPELLDQIGRKVESRGDNVTSTELYSAGRRVSAAVAPRDTAMNNTTAAIAARLPPVPCRTVTAAGPRSCGALHQLQLQGQQLADAMTAAADAMDSDLF